MHRNPQREIFTPVCKCPSATFRLILGVCVGGMARKELLDLAPLGAFLVQDFLSLLLHSPQIARPAKKGACDSNTLLVFPNFNNRHYVNAKNQEEKGF